MISLFFLFLEKYMIFQFILILFLIVWDYFLIKIKVYLGKKYDNSNRKLDDNLTLLIMKIKLFIGLDNLLSNLRSYYITSGSFIQHHNQQLYNKITSNSFFHNFFVLLYFFFGPLKRNIIILIITIYRLTDWIQTSWNFILGISFDNFKLNVTGITILPSMIVLMIIISSIYFLSSKGRILRTVYKLNQDKLSIKVMFHLKNAVLIRRIINIGSENNNYIINAKNYIIIKILKNNFDNISYVNEDEVIFGFSNGFSNDLYLNSIEEITDIKSLYEDSSKEVEDSLYNYGEKNKWFEIEYMDESDFNEICFTSIFFDKFEEKWNNNIKNSYDEEINNVDFSKEIILEKYNEIDKDLNYVLVNNIEKLLLLNMYCRFVEKKFKKTPFLFDFFGYLTNKEK